MEFKIHGKAEIRLLRVVLSFRPRPLERSSRMKWELLKAHSELLVIDLKTKESLVYKINCIFLRYTELVVDFIRRHTHNLVWVWRRFISQILMKNLKLSSKEAFSQKRNSRLRRLTSLPAPCERWNQTTKVGLPNERLLKINLWRFLLKQFLRPKNKTILKIRPTHKRLVPIKLAKNTISKSSWRRIKKTSSLHYTSWIKSSTRSSTYRSKINNQLKLMFKKKYPTTAKSTLKECNRLLLSKWNTDQRGISRSTAHIRIVSLTTRTLILFLATDQNRLQWQIHRIPSLPISFTYHSCLSQASKLLWLLQRQEMIQEVSQDLKWHGNFIPNKVNQKIPNLLNQFTITKA